MDETDATPETTPTEPAPATRLRLVFAAPDGDKPFQALRVGTFTDMYGRESTFAEADLEAIADSINGSSRKLPITERHDFGRAVGRMLKAETKYGGKRLYITPKWSAAGRALLEDAAYDGFSIELERGKASYVAIGGALTNYPAVDGLSPLSLSAPVAGEPSVLVLPSDPDTTPTEEIPMSDTPETPVIAPAPESVASPALPPMPAISDEVARQQIAAYSQAIQAQMQQQFEAIRKQAEQEAIQRFERWQAEQEQASQIRAFAQNATTPTIDRRHALPFTADQLIAVFSALPVANRPAVRGLLEDILAHGLVPYDTLGASGEGKGETDPAEEYQEKVRAYTAQGMSRSAAIIAIQKNHPEIYRAYNASGKGGR